MEVLLIHMMIKNPVQGIKMAFHDDMCYWDKHTLFPFTYVKGQRHGETLFLLGW